jgi:hypothetical protein
MTSPLALEIREQILRLLEGQLSLDDFEDWLVANSWNVHQSGDAELTDLVFEIELHLSELSNGHLDEAELQSALRSIVSTSPSVTRQ